MQIQPKNLYHTFLTLLGLLLLAAVVVLNHFHPRNQGIADLSHSSIYKIAAHNNTNPATTPSTFAYAAIISTSPSKPAANRLADPTSSSNPSAQTGSEVDAMASQSNDQSCTQNSSSNDDKAKKNKPTSEADTNCQLPSSYPAIE